MADDTRQSPQEDLSKEGLTVDPNYKPFSGSQWEDAKKDYRPPNANMLAGGTEHTAGGKIPEVSISSAFDGSLKLSDFTDLPTKPCVRDALLTGLPAGFAASGVRFIFGAPLFTACSWFVGGACITSGVMYQWCQHKRKMERDGMMRAVEILNKKDIEKKAREAAKERQREERRKLKEEELDAQYNKLRAQDANTGNAGTSKPWWKVW